jgi:hypothetical protein
VGDHPENCDDLCRYIERLHSQQESLLAEMQAIRQERPAFTARPNDEA